MNELVTLQFGFQLLLFIFLGCFFYFFLPSFFPHAAWLGFFQKG